MKAYTKGEKAFNTGVSYRRNPYNAVSSNAMLWNMGWSNAAQLVAGALVREGLKC